MTDPRLDLSRAPRIADMINAWFCPQCGLRDETMRGIDQDGTCSSCGADCCTWDSVRGHLAHYGWEVVSADDARELSRIRAEATAEPEPEPTCPGPDCSACNGSACWKCGAGLQTMPPGTPLCEHDGMERHEISEQPPLRTRAAIDREIAQVASSLINGYQSPSMCRDNFTRLLAEQPTPRAELTGEERAVLEHIYAAHGQKLGNDASFEFKCREMLARRAAARKETGNG